MSKQLKALAITAGLLVGWLLLGVALSSWLDGDHGRLPSALALGASGWFALAAFAGRATVK